MAQGYLPAAGRDRFLPLYDPLTRLLGFQAAIRPLIAQAQLAPGMHVLDLGCGTGTVAVRVATEHPGVKMTGLDPDPLALARASRKAARARVSIAFERGFGEQLPYADRTFDRVLSSMMFHHLRKEVRAAVLSEIHRVLRPGGRLELLDFAGGAHTGLAQLLHGNHLDAAAEDRLIRRMGEAGLSGATRVASRKTLVGAIAYYQASRSN
jgi:ubiquinone/menaquinone biosynthesis C-methylase UbiE